MNNFKNIKKYFKNIKRYTIKELREQNYLPIKNIKSHVVYIIEKPDNFEVNFLDTTTAHKYKVTGSHKKTLCPKEELLAIYNKTDKEYLYVGKGEQYNNGNPVGYNRLIQYLKYGEGKKYPHDGGKYLWQIENNENLSVFWIPCNNPCFLETYIIEQYKINYNTYPFANAKSGNSNTVTAHCKNCPDIVNCITSLYPRN